MKFFKIKTFLNYIFYNKKNYYLINNNDNNQLSLIINSNNYFYLFCFFKLSTIFYLNTVLDMFSYEIFKNINNFKKIFIIILNNIFLKTKILLFLIFNNNKNNLKSVNYFFQNTGWLEREVSEMNKFFFVNKKDSRNLLLPYHDLSYPLNKSYPSIGFKEIFFDLINDLLIYKNITIQF